MAHPCGGAPVVPDSQVIFSTVHESPGSVSPLPACLSKSISQRRNSTSFLEAHTYFQPTLKTITQNVLSADSEAPSCIPEVFFVAGTERQKSSSEPVNVHVHRLPEHVIVHSGCKSSLGQLEEQHHKMSHLENTSSFIQQEHLIDLCGSTAYTSTLGTDNQFSPAEQMNFLQQQDHTNQSCIPHYGQFTGQKVIAGQIQNVRFEQKVNCLPQITLVCTPQDPDLNSLQVIPPSSAPAVLGCASEGQTSCSFDFHFQSSSPLALENSGFMLSTHRGYLNRHGSTDVNIEDAAQGCGMYNRLQTVAEEQQVCMCRDVVVPPVNFIRQRPDSPNKTNDSLLTTSNTWECPSIISDPACSDTSPPKQAQVLFQEEYMHTRIPQSLETEQGPLPSVPVQGVGCYQQSSQASQSLVSHQQPQPATNVSALPQTSITHPGPAHVQQQISVPAPVISQSLSAPAVPVNSSLFSIGQSLSTPVVSQHPIPVLSTSVPAAQGGFQSVPVSVTTTLNQPVSSVAPSVPAISQVAGQSVVFGQVPVSVQVLPHLSGAVLPQSTPQSAPSAALPTSLGQVADIPLQKEEAVHQSYPSQYTKDTSMAQVTATLPSVPSPPSSVSSEAVSQPAPGMSTVTSFCGPSPAQQPVPQPTTTAHQLPSGPQQPQQASQEVSAQIATLDQTQGQVGQVSSSVDSAHSDVASGMSDGNEGVPTSGRHEGRSTKRYLRKSARSRSRHEKSSRSKLRILNVSNKGDRVVECQLETHNRKMVTFKFDLDGDNPEEIATIMVQNDFILAIERDSFVEQVRDIIEKADEMLSEDTCGEQDGDQVSEGFRVRETSAFPVSQNMLNDLRQPESITFLPPVTGILQGSATHVVHSAGRRFIVSPVPESRLQEQPFFGSGSVDFPVSVSSHGTGISLSHSASSVSLQQAFAELRHTPLQEGPSTAPPQFNQAVPPLPVVVPSQDSSTLPSASPTLGTVSIATVPPHLTQAIVSPLAQQTVSGVVPDAIHTSSVPPSMGSQSVVGSVVINSVMPEPTQQMTGITTIVSDHVAFSTAVLPQSAQQNISSPVPTTLSTVSPPIMSPLVHQMAGSNQTSVSAPSLQSLTSQTQAQPVGPVATLNEIVSSSVQQSQSDPVDSAETLPLGSTVTVSLPMSLPLNSSAVTMSQFNATHPVITQSLAAVTPVLSQASGSIVTPLQAQVPLLGMQTASSAPLVQQTLVHSQPQPAVIPNQPHTHCSETDVEAQIRAPGIDDIKTLDEKLRSLFSEHGSTGTAYTLGQAEMPVTSEIPAASTTTSTTVMPPSSLMIGTTDASTVSVLVTPGQTATPSFMPSAASVPPAGKLETPSSKPTLGRTLVLPLGAELPAVTPPAEPLPPFPGPSLTQSQQPLEDLDAQVRRALSPETILVPSQPAQIVASVDTAGQTVTASQSEVAHEDDCLSDVTAARVIKLGRFQVAVRTDDILTAKTEGTSLEEKEHSIKTPPQSMSSSSSSSSLSESSPESTLVKTPFKKAIPDIIDGLSEPESVEPKQQTASAQPNKIGRFQVTTMPDKVGRFSVSRTKDELSFADENKSLIEASVISNSSTFVSEHPGQPSDLTSTLEQENADETVQTAHLNGPSSDLEDAYLSSFSVKQLDNGHGSPVSPNLPQQDSKGCLSSHYLSNSFNSSYMSSDNDSDIEDEDLKKELHQLRQKHLKEIQELQARQRQEIEELYTRMGKVPPPVIIPPAAPLSGRRRRHTKGKSGRSSRSSLTGNKVPFQLDTSSPQNVSSLLSPEQNLFLPSSSQELEQSQMLQPFKPSPSNENVGSTFTSDVAMSVPSLSAPAQGWAKFNCVSERVTFKPGGRRTRFLRKMMNKVCPCNQMCRTNSTNTVGSTGTVGTNQTGLAQQTGVPSIRKGTFTDDLHKLVDNWARDAMNFTGKRAQKPQGQNYSEAPGMTRKFSAPGHLCSSLNSSLSGSTSIPAASVSSLGPSRKIVCPPPQYGFSAAPYSTQWTATTGSAPQALGQFQTVTPGTATSLQGFSVTTLQKSISNPPGSNLRTT
ncbi:serine/threonine-protein kinase WNK1-like [Protopterus annectens]|uniref:serine/threonine-protein kinase WNK1-like n=1 Tax=Protopterus annectens TaxID=7888 RepID=UPI001CFC2D33|nr:serine/threonine-protein kinase WNK1-like [Protopterus annectens]